MAIFTNDLSAHITLIQHEEMLESLNAKYKRNGKEMAIKTGIVTGAVVASSTIAVQTNHPEVMLLTMCTLAIANHLYDLYIKNKKLKPYKIDYKNINNIDYRQIAKSHRENDRYNGKLTFTSPYRYELQDKEEVEEEFGYSSDNDLPSHFLEQQLVPSRMIREYELYSKRYQVPTLNITEEQLTIFINKLVELLKKVNLSHRIYYYGSEYMKRLIAKGIINYWDEINFQTILDHMDIFTNIELSENDIQEFKKQFELQDKTKKL